MINSASVDGGVMSEMIETLGLSNECISALVEREIDSITWLKISDGSFYDGDKTYPIKNQLSSNGIFFSKKKHVLNRFKGKENTYQVKVKLPNALKMAMVFQFDIVSMGGKGFDIWL